MKACKLRTRSPFKADLPRIFLRGGLLLCWNSLFLGRILKDKKKKIVSKPFRQHIHDENILYLAQADLHVLMKQSTIALKTTDI